MEDGWALDGAGGGGSPQVATSWLQVTHLHPCIHESYLRSFAPTEKTQEQNQDKGSEVQYERFCVAFNLGRKRYKKIKKEVIVCCLQQAR